MYFVGAVKTKNQELKN